MANTLHSSVAVRRQVAATSATYSLPMVVSLRLICGLLVTVGAIVFLLGVGWDIQWHEFVGRDRTLIPPHVMMLSGVTLSGLVALVCVLLETRWSRYSSTIAKVTTPFTRFFRASLGSYLAGFAALNAAIAFPLDAYWHSLYGIDVSIIAPFHIMFLLGMTLVALGGAYMLISSANLAFTVGSPGRAWIGRLGALCAFAVVVGLLTIIGFGNLLFYPIIVSFLAAWAIFAAYEATGWRWAGTGFGIIFGLYALILYVMTPFAMDTLLRMEHLSYRVFHSGNPHISMLSEYWPLGIIVAAVLIDLLRWLGQRYSWRQVWLVVGMVILLGVLSSILFSPVMFSAGMHLRSRTSLFLIFMFPAVFCATFGWRIGRNTGLYLRALER
ncbi:hypothetical protein ccbrp13_16020 [Ktedonobacteria bacterium brp13]|nr:hypothetical protein ccbrp13_16020 [Ktedonobacteria bacterium brp13]